MTGPGNDVVKVYVDGVLKKTGTTWENYYRYDPEQTGNGNVVPTTSKILIRESGVPAPLNLNNGFLVDGLSLASSTPTTTNCKFVFSGGQYMDLRNDCTTDGTILIPNGYELRGYQHTITAIDPPGAVLRRRGRQERRRVSERHASQGDDERPRRCLSRRRRPAARHHARRRLRPDQLQHGHEHQPGSERLPGRQCNRGAQRALRRHPPRHEDDPGQREHHSRLPEDGHRRERRHQREHQPQQRWCLVRRLAR